MKIVRIVKRVLFVIIIVAVLGFFLSGYIVSWLGGKAPKAADAPWAIQTTSLLYYGKEFSMQQGAPSLKGYWVEQNNRWKYHSDIIEFPKELYGQVAIIKR